MIKIIIIFALIQLGYNLLFKPNYTNLCCGLFGAASDDASNININKVKILGIFNDTRGGHSCGMAIDGDIMIGVNSEKKFQDFITKNNVDQPYLLPVVLGHTRAATFGAHTVENAHPFGFGVNEEYFHFMGAHNGTLQNKDEIADLFGIETSENVPSKHNANLTTVRQKIDSEILLEIIYTHGYKVLEHYIGAAALSMYDTKKPSTLYLYHGKSKKLQSDELAIEERPLFYYQESPNVVYYSSIKESLEAINDTYGDIVELDHNCVYEIKNGNVAKAKKIKIDRSKAYQSNTVRTNFVSVDYSKKQWCYTTKKWIDKIETPNVAITAATSAFKENLDNLYDHKLFFERTQKEFCKTNVYYENLRFFRDSTLLDGIYFLTKDQDLRYISFLIENIEVNYHNSPDNIKMDGEPILFYFVKGILLRNEKDYHPVRLLAAKQFDYQRVSHCSVYPIKSLVDAAYNKVYFRGNIADLKFTTLVGKNIITIRNGDVITISDKDIDFEKNEKYYLPEDLELIQKIIKNESLSQACEITLTDETKEEEIITELYADNILATVDYCKDDIEDSVKKESSKTDLKSKLEMISNFVSTTLNFKK